MKRQIGSSRPMDDADYHNIPATRMAKRLPGSGNAAYSPSSRCRRGSVAEHSVSEWGLCALWRFGYTGRYGSVCASKQVAGKTGKQRFKSWNLAARREREALCRLRAGIQHPKSRKLRSHTGFSRRRARAEHFRRQREGMLCARE